MLKKSAKLQSPEGAAQAWRMSPHPGLEPFRVPTILGLTPPGYAIPSLRDYDPDLVGIVLAAKRVTQKPSTQAIDSTQLLSWQ
jgi:hypothetical protein